MDSTRTGSGGSTAPHVDTAVREALASAQRQLADRTASYGFLFVTPQMELGRALRTAGEAAPGVDFLACTTAGEITEEGLTKGGIAVLLVATEKQKHRVDFTKQAREPAVAAAELAKSLPGLVAAGDTNVSTTILLMDGLSGTGEDVVDRMYSEAAGKLHEIVGGAAGDNGAFSGTYVGAGKTVAVNAAAALHIAGESRWGIGVDHGLSPATALMRVTKATGNVVHEIDGRPSFEVYKEYAQELGTELTSENVSQFLINNELGVVMFDKLRKARAPLSVTDTGGLVCAAEVPQGASVCILGGSADELVSAAQRAAKEAQSRLGRRRAAGVLLFDCICRGAILGDEFAREVRAIREVFPGVPMAGFLTYGEIARYSGRLDGWHNTTAVVAAIPE